MFPAISPIFPCPNSKSTPRRIHVRIFSSPHPFNPSQYRRRLINLPLLPPTNLPIRSRAVPLLNHNRHTSSVAVLAHPRSNIFPANRSRCPGHRSVRRSSVSAMAMVMMRVMRVPRDWTRSHVDLLDVRAAVVFLW